MAERKILTQADLDYFLQHPLCHNLLKFIESLNASVIGKKRTDVRLQNGVVEKLLSTIDYCKFAIEDYRPTSRSSRFGHVEFRNYYDHLLAKVPQLFIELVPTEFHDYIPELTSYFCSSFGNRQRIDYGTGHELHFCVFLMCLDQIFDFGSEVYSEIVLILFWSYLDWMRVLQATFWLEPAGSHGVWGLDDYHFLPFLFGSSQLIEHKYIRPKSIHNRDVVTQYSDEFMYLKCIDFVNKIKAESIIWHSPMLNDISGVKKWSKINEGMRKMFVGEVLKKLPIMQHLLFGTLFGRCVLEQSTCKFKHDTNEDFLPPSGICLPSTVRTHKVGCSQALEDEPTVEVIVKYVKNSRGEDIPIYGRVLASEVNADGEHSEGDSRLIDIFAFGQARPTCCGIRIPSILSTPMGNQNELPFD